jgi:methylamine dehydrogenase heavy chain
LLAINQATKQMYVAMHPNGAEGSHKTPAAEIWVYDLATHKRIARVPGKGALSMSVSQDDKPRLFTIDGGNVSIFDATPAAPVFQRTIQAAGETALQVEPQPLGGPR